MMERTGLTAAVAVWTHCTLRTMEAATIPELPVNRRTGRLPNDASVFNLVFSFIAQSRSFN